VPRGPRNERLNIFLMKEGTTRQETVGADVAGLATAPIRAGLNFQGEILTKRTPAGPPRWRQFVQSGTDQGLGDLTNQSASCLIVLTASNRVFAIAFGAARHWIDDTRIVRRFGMIVTLNTVHRDGIRSVDREEFETIQRKTRSQTSVSASIENFGLDVQRDLVRSVTGRSEDEAFARHITGADNLVIDLPVPFDQLGNKCGEALAHFGRRKYRANYKWIDNFARVTDPSRIAELDNELVATLRTGTPENAFLTPPDTLDMQQHRGFRYPFQREDSDAFSDLNMEDFLARIDPAAITIKNLHDWRIREYGVDDDSPTRTFRVYNAIVYEVFHGRKLFAFSLGEWFEIARNHVTAVNNEVAGIADLDQLDLTEAREGELEEDYSRRISEASGGRLALLDQELVVYGGGRSRIEICDLLSDDRNFIHIKPKTKSSTLSHLFAQGLNSAQAFRDARFRELARAKCPATHQHIFDGQPRIGDHTVTFGIITAAAANLRDVLPFFSKQSLANAARELVNMGYQIRLKKISLLPVGA